MTSFDRAAREYGRVGPSLFEHFGRRVADIAGVSRGQSCLDVATGTGAAILAAAEATGEASFLVGADLSHSMLLRLTEETLARQLSRVHAIRMDAQQLATHDDVFDVVLCGFALDSFADPEMAITEIHRVLRPGGRLGVTVSNLWWFEGDKSWAWLERLLGSLGAEVHDRPPAFTEPEHLNALLFSGGFTDVEVTQEEFPLRFTDFEEWWLWGWSHGYRRILDALSEADLSRYRLEASRELGRNAEIQARTQVLLACGTSV
jgi:SAM-dependent methyltransferase